MRAPKTAKEPETPAQALGLEPRSVRFVICAGSVLAAFTGDSMHSLWTGRKVGREMFFSSELRCERCCKWHVDRTSAERPWWQSITFGTTAWRISMGRHQMVESVNAALKGVFADLGRGLMRVMGLTRMTVMPGFTIASFNLDHIRSFRAKDHFDAEGRPTERPRQARAKRRPGTWADVIEGTGARPS